MDRDRLWSNGGKSLNDTVENINCTEIQRCACISLRHTSTCNVIRDTLWSYYNGNLGFVTPYGVILKLPSNKGRQNENF